MRNKLYVVRIEEDGEEPDYTAFGSRKIAEVAYYRAAVRTHDEDFLTSALFDVPGANVREAVDAVKAGDKKRVSLLKLNECLEIWVKKAA